MKTIIARTVVHSESGYAQTIESSGHRLTADEPEARGGTNTGPAPYELLLAALGACTAITLRMYAQRKGWELGDVKVQLRHLRGADGRDEIERDIQIGAALSDEQRTRLAEIADKTPVTKTLASGAAITTRML